MKLGVFTNLYRNLPLDEALALYESLGIEAVELGAGGNPGNHHCNPEVLLADEGALAEWLETIKKHNMTIAALSVHGNPVHPDPEIAARDHRDFVNAVLLAEKIGVDTIVTFSGCPGGAPGDKTTNWVTCTWPTMYSDILEYQWNDVLIPYWREAAAFAKAHGVNKIALEMHPGFTVYNPTTLLRLREAVGDVIGANLDPSHLIWQGVDIVAAIRALRGAIYHFHAKDTKIDRYNCAVGGVLDTKRYGNVAERSWIFRSVGFGHGMEFWREIISELRTNGYDGVLSIEHEDALMSKYEGLSYAATFLRQSLMKEPSPTEFAWEKSFK
ncbi:MAG: sugar phosphate isomerase/epimerase [Clostridia bacterium]|nr:sugar phosphate isomerase/epimerase [Clostridia bacterium]